MASWEEPPGREEDKWRRSYRQWLRVKKMGAPYNLTESPDWQLTVGSLTPKILQLQVTNEIKQANKICIIVGDLNRVTGFSAHGESSATT